MEGKKVKVAGRAPDEVCDLCGRPMVIKMRPVRQVPGLLRLPRVPKHQASGQGHRRRLPQVRQAGCWCARAPKGRIYYGCEQLPRLRLYDLGRPRADKCAKCGSTLFRKGSKLYCAKEGCGFTKPIEQT